jgi:betaine-aldehyde dehydrogenase
VWSRHIERPIRVARKLQAGLVSINSWTNLAIEFGEGGFEASGVGRLGGTASLDDFALAADRHRPGWTPHDRLAASRR